MYWMDIASALAAMKHSGSPVVTASVDNISFENPIRLGNVVHIEAKVSRAFTSSMEVHMKVWGEDALKQVKCSTVARPHVHNIRYHILDYLMHEC